MLESLTPRAILAGVPAASSFLSVALVPAVARVPAVACVPGDSDVSSVAVVPDAGAILAGVSAVISSVLLWLRSLPLLASLVMPTSLLLLASLGNFTKKHKVVYRNTIISVTICLLQAFEVSHFWNMGVCDTIINRQPIWRHDYL